MVSVVIPYYNQLQYLDECLESLRAQTFHDWEAIIVDDGSTGGPIEARIALLRDSRLRLVRHSRNRGLGAARNTGFRNATRELVLPLDSDDCLEPSYLDSTVRALKETPEAECVFTDFRLFGSRSDVWKFEVRGAAEMLERQWIPGSGTLMRKRLWVITGGYAELPRELSGNEDWDFWIGATAQGVKAIHIPKPLYMYRRHAEAMSTTTLEYNDYRIREIIYRRRQDVFDSYRAGGRFRAMGYLNSAAACLKRGEYGRAAWLVVRGLALRQSGSEVRKKLARAALSGIWGWGSRRAPKEIASTM